MFGNDTNTIEKATGETDIYLNTDDADKVRKALDKILSDTAEYIINNLIENPENLYKLQISTPIYTENGQVNITPEVCTECFVRTDSRSKTSDGLSEENIEGGASYNFMAEVEGFITEQFEQSEITCDWEQTHIINHGDDREYVFKSEYESQYSNQETTVRISIDNNFKDYIYKNGNLKPSKSNDKEVERP